MSLCLHDHHEGLHPVHSADEVASRLGDIERFCQQQGWRLTALRKQVLQMILQAEGPIGAYDLLAGLDTVGGRRAAPPTVYRSLDFLLEHGFIHRLSSINAYIPCCHPREGHQAAFLICQNCQQVQETSAARVIQALANLAAVGDFVPKHTSIEISGLCGRCSNE